MFLINIVLLLRQSLPRELLVTTVSFMAPCRVGRKTQWSHWKSVFPGEMGKQASSKQVGLLTCGQRGSAYHRPKQVSTASVCFLASMALT